MWSFVAFWVKRTELNKVNVSCSLVSFFGCVFLLLISERYEAGTMEHVCSPAYWETGSGIAGVTEKAPPQKK